MCVGLLSYGSLLGHLFGVSSYYAFGQYSSISIHTSLALLSVAGGVLLLHPGRALMQTATNALPGGTMARYTGVYILLPPPAADHVIGGAHKPGRILICYGCKPAIAAVHIWHVSALVSDK